MSDEREKKLSALLVNYTPVLNDTQRIQIQSEFPSDLPDIILKARQEIYRRISITQDDQLPTVSK